MDRGSPPSVTKVLFTSWASPLLRIFLPFSHRQTPSAPRGVSFSKRVPWSKQLNPWLWHQAVPQQFVDLPVFAYSDFSFYINIIWKTCLELKCEGLVGGVQWEQEGKGWTRLDFPLNFALVQFSYFNLTLLYYSSNNAIHILVCFKQKSRFQNHIEPYILNNCKCFHL